MLLGEFWDDPGRVLGCSWESFGMLLGEFWDAPYDKALFKSDGAQIPRRRSSRSSSRTPSRSKRIPMLFKDSNVTHHRNLARSA